MPDDELFFFYGKIKKYNKRQWIDFKLDLQVVFAAMWSSVQKWMPVPENIGENVISPFSTDIQRAWNSQELFIVIALNPSSTDWKHLFNDSTDFQQFRNNMESTKEIANYNSHEC